MNNKLTLSILCLLLGSVLFAQHPNGDLKAGGKPNGSGSISGVIVDKLSQHVMEYANIVIYSQRDSTLVNGTVSDEKGYFKIDEIPFGMHFVKVSFLGYSEKTIDKIKVSPQKANNYMGEILLSPSNANIADVEVVAEQSPVLYKIDKKVITVNSNLNTSGGTAVEVLENTPSVQVDIEGNVSLRGSSNFTVLVDGRPSPFSGSDALEQIPAGTIEKIEIITNPSAKYDPDGTAGIINVITRKRSLEGTSGIINLNTDSNGSLGGDFIFSLKKEKVNYTLSANYNDRQRRGYRESDVWNKLGDTTFHTFSEGDREVARIGSSVKAGIDYSISPRDNLTMSLNVGEMSFERKAVSDYHEWTNPENEDLYRISKDLMTRGGKFYTGNLDYIHNFDSDGHNLKTSIFYKTGNSYSEDATDLFTTDETLTYGSVSYEDGNGYETRFKIDYTLPFSEWSKFEAGYQTRIDDETESYGVYKRVFPGGSLSSDIMDETVSKYNRLIHSAYSIYANEWKNFGYQIGLRGEYTKRTMENTASGKTYTIDRLDYFPSAHFSYQLPADQQLMTSYSRRIDRPRNY